MGKHRADPPRRVRARYGRIAAAGTAVVVTLVALIGGLGFLPVGAAPSDEDPSAAKSTSAQVAPTREAPVTETPTPSPAPTAAPPATVAPTPEADPAALPADAGSGRRVVFSEEEQRVWLVDADDKVVSTYLVSGSVTDNLHPGDYEVYSRSRWAVGIDDSGTMEYFVRFTRGNNAAIGFHSIPTKDGQALQTTDQLGTPQSHGCIRQELADAKRLWDFADIGTEVVVV